MRASVRGIIDCPVAAVPHIPLSGGEVECVGKHLSAAGLLK